MLIKNLFKLLSAVSEAEGRSLCNHRRAYKFFTDSVSSRCQFPAMSCESFDKYLAGHCFPCPEGGNCGNMGYYADKAKGRGALYLVTREEEPFCGQYSSTFFLRQSLNANHLS